MYDQLTPSDIKKMEEEIEHRKLVVRPKALEDGKNPPKRRPRTLV